MLAVAQPAEVSGTPVEAVTAPVAQETFPLPGEVSILIGLNPDAARMVARSTGDPIAWPFRTIGYLRDLEAVAVFVLHAFERTGAGARMEVSAEVRSLPLTRQMLGCLAVSVFYGYGADTVLMRVRRSDHRTRRALERMGFTAAGPALRADRTPGLLYALDARTVLPRWQRYCRRYLPAAS